MSTFQLFLSRLRMEGMMVLEKYVSRIKKLFDSVEIFVPSEQVCASFLAPVDDSDVDGEPTLQL